MKKTINEQQLRQLVKRIIREDAVADSLKGEEQVGGSVDDQIDRYFSEFEKEAQASVSESVHFRNVCRMLLEADDEDEQAAPPALNELNVEKFANSVVRLIENYENMLEFHDAIATRAVNFLVKSYDAGIVKEFKDALREQHGIVPGSSKRDVDDEQSEAPNSALGGPDLGGAASGG